MRRRRRRRLLIAAVPLLGLATAGSVYLASNDVPPSNAGVSTFNVSCNSADPPICTTTPRP